MPQGTIKKIAVDKGFGFIRPDNGEQDVFFHHSSVADGAFESLNEGQAVSFEVTSSPKGPRAENVAPVD
jgi:CspA family cold shock protein